MWNQGYLKSALRWLTSKNYVMAQLLAHVIAKHSKSVRYKLMKLSGGIWTNTHIHSVHLPMLEMGHCVWWRWLPRQSSEDLLHLWQADVLPWGHLSLCPKSWSEWHLTLCRRWNRYLFWCLMERHSHFFLRPEDRDENWNILWPFTPAGVTATVSCGSILLVNSRWYKGILGVRCSPLF